MTIGGRDSQSETGKHDAQKRGGWMIVAIFILATLFAGAGFAFLDEKINLLKHEATSDGVDIRIENVNWVEDQMDIGLIIPMPKSMMPDMPDHGDRRLSLAIVVSNHGSKPEVFLADEIVLKSGTGKSWIASSPTISELSLTPGQLANIFLNFDIAQAETANLRLLWRRNGMEQRLMAVSSPPPAHLKVQTAKTGWPDNIEELPLGNAKNGASLFDGQYACISCHGHRNNPDSNTVAPHLGNISTNSNTNWSAQYVFESILDPDAVIAETCKENVACSSPSEMPTYRNSMSHQDMADIVAYLLKTDNSQDLWIKSRKEK